MNFGQEVGSSFFEKCTALDFFCSAFPFFYVWESKDCEKKSEWMKSKD